MEELPPAEFQNSQEPCGPDETCTDEDYVGWWTQGQKLYDYLAKMPPAYADRVGMGKMHKQLLERWSLEVRGVEGLPEVVDDSTLGTLLLWIRHAETLVYYITYQDQGSPVPGPTTPGRLDVKESIRSSEWHWPWIEGWDDAALREKIINPTTPSKWGVKRVLMVGAGVAGAVYVGKRFFS